MKKYYIYRIEFPNGQFYIGQTSQAFVWMRWDGHINKVRAGKHNNQHIQNICDDYGYSDWKFEVLLELESDDPHYVSLMEKTIIDDHPNTTNQISSTKQIRVDIKYKDDPKTYVRLYQKEWARQHYKDNKLYHRDYYQQNKERISKKYYDNKEVDKVV